MARTFITSLSTLAAFASLSLGPAYAQSRGSHNATSQPARPVAHTPPTTSGKPTPPPVAQRIDSHPQLVTRLTPLVPAGMTLDQAAQGFKNQGQFIAALHVSHNLNIPFDKLKADMTGAKHDSLGQAIHDLRPTANAKAEARKAEAEAKADLKAAGKKADTDHDRDDK